MAAAVNDIDGKVMHHDLLNEKVKEAQYAVRGELYLRGEELRKEGKEIIFTNSTRKCQAVCDWRTFFCRRTSLYCAFAAFTCC